MMKFAILLVLVVAASAVVLQDRDEVEFTEYLKKYNKVYRGDEFLHRLAVFKNTKLEVARLNADARSKGKNTQFGLTKFADLTKEEFSSAYLGYKKTSNAVPVAARNVDAPLPVSFDWQAKGAVTPVKDQQQCGSCWAFSATEGVESAYFLAKNKLNVLSPQQIVSCDTTDSGCNGGDLPTAFAYVQQNGMETEAAYPYTSGGGDSGTCTFDASDVVVQISGFQYATTTGNETQMQVALQQNGPLSICVDAETWQTYTGGVITNNCGDSLDHCVQITGWNVDKSTGVALPYWNVRNSWNTDWGINGYIWVERNSDLCGIADEATYVTI